MDENRSTVFKRKSAKEEITILACDPSLTAWGWVVLNLKGKVLDAGCIKTSPSSKKLRIRKGDDRCRRVSEINQKLLSIIERYNVHFILSEQPHGSQSAVAAVMIGICLGVLQTLADSLRIGIEWYSEGDCKKCLLGKRNASKGETIQAIKELYPDMIFIGTKYMDEAIADAAAVYHYGVENSNVLRICLK